AAREYPRRRHLVRTRQIHQQKAPVLLRLRRTLRHGSAGRAGGGPPRGLPHRRRPRRLEEGRRASGWQVNLFLGGLVFRIDSKSLIAFAKTSAPCASAVSRAPPCSARGRVATTSPTAISTSWSKSVPTHLSACLTMSASCTASKISFLSASMYPMAWP